MDGIVMDDAASLDLPADPQALRELLVRTLHERDTVTRERDGWKLRHDRKQRECDQKEIERLRLEVELLRLKKWYYGRRADALQHPDDAAQLVLAFAGQVQSLPPPQAEDAEAVADDA